jgi:hypothetical protein
VDIIGIFLAWRAIKVGRRSRLALQTMKEIFFGTQLFQKNGEWGYTWPERWIRAFKLFEEKFPEASRDQIQPSFIELRVIDRVKTIRCCSSANSL